MTSRIAEYFLVVGLPTGEKKDPIQTLFKVRLRYDPTLRFRGSSSHVLPRSRPQGVRIGEDLTLPSFRPVIIDRFPEKNHDDINLPGGIETFCFPAGVSFSSDPVFPKVHHFVATVENGVKLYGTSLTFSDPLREGVAAAVLDLATRQRTRALIGFIVLGHRVPIL